MAGLVRAVETVLSQRRGLETELEHRAQHDDLTGLANRRMFSERAEMALGQSPGGGVHVLFLDLDRFKSINDSLGHGAGDQLLVIVSRRLSGALHPGDTIARLGGDEFAVLLGDDLPERSLDSVRAALSAVVEQPIPLQGLDLKVTASIGTANGEPNDTLEDLIHRADMAMYEQKAKVHRRVTAEPAWELDKPAGASSRPPAA